VKPLSRIVVVAIAVGVASTLTGTAAQAEKNGGARPSAAAARASVVGHTAAVSLAEQRRVARSWTPARMKAARSGDLLAPPSTGTARRGPVTGRTLTVPARAARSTSVTTTSTTDSTGEVYTGGGAVVKTTGRVFFRIGTAGYSCSGSAVNSTNKDVVLTAGHCVNEGPNAAFVTDWVFVPGYVDGRAPHGVFTARHLLTTSAWAFGRDRSGDVGFAVVNTVGGRHLTDVVGGQGIAFNRQIPTATSPFTFPYTHTFGYPVAAPYNGEALVHCAGTPVPDPNPFRWTQAIACDMAAGASGGPWFHDFDPVTGTGTLGSVNSFIEPTLPGVVFAPYFDSAVASIYQVARSL